MSFEKISNTSERIKKAMVIREMKQIDLVHITGIDKGSISHYVSGTYEPKNEALHKLSKALDVSEMWLWGYNVPMERAHEQKSNIELDPINTANVHADIVMDDDFVDLYEDYRLLDSSARKVVKDLVRTLADKK